MIIGGLYLLVLWTLSIGNISKLANNSVPGGSVNSLVFQSKDKAVLAFVLFMCLWWLSFFKGINAFIIGAVIGCWYFTKEKSSLFNPVSVSIKNCLKFHLGSIARGSAYKVLFSAPGYLLFVFISFMKSHSKSKACLCLACLLSPVTWVYNSYAKYYTGMAYIYIGIFGYPYTLSSRQCYYLLKRNNERFKNSIGPVSSLVFHLKLCISLLGFTSTYLFLTLSPYTLLGFETSNLSSTLAPAVFTLFTCIFLGEVIAETISSCVNSMNLCIIADEEMHTVEQRYMKNNLKDQLDKIGVDSKQITRSIEVQKPGRSDRLPVNLLNFDKDFNVRVDTKVFPTKENLKIIDYEYEHLSTNRKY